MLEVKLRRYGFGVVHSVRLPGELVRPAVQWGSEYQRVDGPIVARCGVTLRGQCVVMNADQAVDCAVCRYILAAA